MLFHPVRSIVYIFFFLFPLTPVFSLNTYLPIPLILSSLFFLLNMTLPGTKVQKIDTNLVLLSYSTLLAMAISFTLNVLLGEEVSVNHFFGILLMYFFYLAVPLIMLSKVRLKKVFFITNCSFLVIVSFGFVDFFAYNFLGFSLSEAILFFPSEYPINYGHFSGFFRNKSIFQEPGFFAWYLNTIGLLITAYFFHVNERKKAIFTFLIYFFSLITTFSATGIIVLLFTSILMIIKLNRKPLYLMLSGLFLILAFYFLYDFLSPIIESKVFGSNSSKLERLERWSGGLTLFKENVFFGAGFGNYSLKESVGLASFPLKVLAEGGLISFVFFILLWIVSFFYVSKFNTNALTKVFLYVSLLASLLHWSTSTPFYFAFSWVYLALINFFTKVTTSDK